MNALILTVLMIGQTQAPPVRGIVQAPPVRQVLTYAQGRAEALRTGQHLMVYVGIKIGERESYVLLCETDSLPGYPAKCIVHCYPKNGELLWAETTDENDRPIKGVKAKPGFFGKRRASADDDLEAAGPWPKEIEKPDGLVRYRRAMFTQEIAVTNNRDRITPVSRFDLESKWHQSGGMDGIAGYRSDVYRFVLSEPRTYVANLPVWNGNNFQNNRGWTRDYPSGTRFDDVLSNTETGKVFEHRSAQKDNSKWTRRVIFKDESQRPEGYVGLQQTCSSCHDQAGTGGYATGLVPGSDTILSDPFIALEQ